MKKRDTAISSILAFAVFIAFLLMFRSIGCGWGCSACSACTATGCVKGCANSVYGRTEDLSGCSGGTQNASSGTGTSPLLNAKEELYINDYIGIIGEEDKQQFISLGNRLELSTGAQLVAVVINNPSVLGTDELWEYATRLFNDWGIGSSNSNNGLLMIVNTAQGAYSGNVCCILGTGLENVLPASELQEVIDDTMLPLMDEGRFSEAALQGYTALYEKLDNLLGG